METATQTLMRAKKANKLVRLAFRKNGPKSYTRGQGALLRSLLANDGITQRELVVELGMSRAALKDIVRKAERNGYVTIENTDEPRTYQVFLTDEGRTLAQKREEANDRTAAEILSVLTDEERAQLDAINEKLIIACKDAGISGKKKGYRVPCKRRAHARACARH